MMNYMPICFKSDYSLLKSLLKIKDIIEYAKNQEFSYVGLLDDNMFGLMDFYDKCQKNNLFFYCFLFIFKLIRY